MSEIERHILKRVRPILRLLDQRIHQVAQIPFILRRRLKHLRAHLHNVVLGVIPRPDQFHELDPLRLRQVAQIPRAEFEDDFLGAGVRFAHVGRVAEAEGVVEGRWGEGFS